MLPAYANLGLAPGQSSCDPAKPSISVIDDFGSKIWDPQWHFGSYVIQEARTNNNINNNKKKSNCICSIKRLKTAFYTSLKFPFFLSLNKLPSLLKINTFMYFTASLSFLMLSHHPPTGYLLAKAPTLTITFCFSLKLEQMWQGREEYKLK